MRRSFTMIAAAACLASALLVAPASAGDTGIVSPPKLFAKKLAKVKANSGIDVYLPSHLRVYVKPTRVYPSRSTSERRTALPHLVHRKSRMRPSPAPSGS